MVDNIQNYIAESDMVLNILYFQTKSDMVEKLNILDHTMDSKMGEIILNFTMESETAEIFKIIRWNQILWIFINLQRVIRQYVKYETEQNLIILYFRTKSNMMDNIKIDSMEQDMK